MHRILGIFKPDYAVPGSYRSWNRRWRRWLESRTHRWRLSVAYALDEMFPYKFCWNWLVTLVLEQDMKEVYWKIRDGGWQRSDCNYCTPAPCTREWTKDETKAWEDRE